MFHLHSLGEAASEFVLVPPRTRRTITANALPALQNAEFSTRVESDVPVVVDRTMSWDGRGYGAHSESSVPAPQSRWYFAEGATIAGFQLFYLVQAVDRDVAIDVTYLLADGNAVQRCYGSSECA